MGAVERGLVERGGGCAVGSAFPPASVGAGCYDSRCFSSTPSGESGNTPYEYFRKTSQARR